MREILFRGKRIDNGEWVEGFYNHIPCGRSWVDEHMIQTVLENGKIGMLHDVDPSTVGQYTGLHDATKWENLPEKEQQEFLRNHKKGVWNGKRIFDGDILHIAKIADGLGGYYQPPFDYPVNVVVKWDLCAWMWETLCEDKRYISFPDAWCHYECEVVGNIHDNPELLKEEAQS